ncbi:putative spermidine/putrescine transport system permease protein [Peptoclostridium litorale DSM 5388]|uniref:Binding-protein-dependent transport system inner membrane protein n=1 Tax=Peptoclostridium litorale DSM 5388 TaxID=1121324 RepID=A0A069RCK4_PEPLI|nr:ABC transporter permease subunit [Peptoclostridium litorale]KDR93975.1 binding-protein-dependent transport system inner membrane protein [Peptoclostridium litorale DSM 5388]KDR95402.1 binding-protein-dependent transport system inner membrane protein [Peptoclostridium litorale DSM 5388]SIN89645.1 putative spermidine/putrescine transport system permease protein [Peptoclostridium litorale DSM 5388]
MFQRIKPYVYLMPSAIILSVIVAGGTAECILQSMGTSFSNGFEKIQFSYYSQIFGSTDFWKSLALTFKLAIISTVIASFVGLGIIFCIYVVRSHGEGSTVGIQRFFQLPMLFPYLVAGYVVFLMFSQSGWISRILFSLGIISQMADFPALINDRWGIGIIIAYVWKTTPFVVLMLYPIILRVESGWIDAGRIFGFTRTGFFAEAVFPLIKPTLKVSAYIVFTFIFCAFEIPYLLGSTYPKALPVYAYQIYSFGSFEERPLAMAMSMVMILVSCIMGIILFWNEKDLKRESGVYFEKNRN